MLTKGFNSPVFNDTGLVGSETEVFALQGCENALIYEYIGMNC